MLDWLNISIVFCHNTLVFIELHIQVGNRLFCGSKARDLSSIYGQLNEVADAFLRTDHIAGGSGLLGASGVHFVCHKPVLRLINLATERQPEMLKFLLLQPALEDAVLHPYAIVLANPGNPVEALKKIASPQQNR